jgi:RNA polymerase sigma-70 factor (ECF subfamily)
MLPFPQADEVRTDRVAAIARDEALVRAVLARDRKATAEFVARYADKIYSYLRHRLLPRADLVEDFAQEVFLVAWRSLDQYRGEAPVDDWLLGIARHKVEDHYRAKLREPVDLPEENDLELSFNPHWDELLDRQQLQERTQKVLSSLPEAYSFALLWRYWEKRSTRDIAALTGRTEKAVERLLARARELFKRRWNDEQSPA